GAPGLRRTFRNRISFALSPTMTPFNTAPVLRRKTSYFQSSAPRAQGLAATRNASDSMTQRPFAAASVRGIGGTSFCLFRAGTIAFTTILLEFAPCQAFDDFGSSFTSA